MTGRLLGMPATDAPRSSPESARGASRRKRGRTVLLLAGALLAYNNGVAGFIPSAWYVPANLCVAALLFVWSASFGLSRRDLGLADGTISGVRWGAAAIGVATVALAVALTAPALRETLEDERVAGIGAGLLAYRALIRIPLGTAVLEEVAFRGVLLGAWMRERGPQYGVVASGLVFGLWHVRPAAELLEVNTIAESTPARLAGIVGAVVLTALGGMAFAWLRLRAGSLVAPLVAHAGINSIAIVAAFVALRLG